MEIIGTIAKVLDPVTGKSEKGFWTRRGVVIEPINKQRKVCLEFSGDDWSDRLGKLKEGDMLKALFEPESIEYGGKWYTRLKAYGMQVYNTSNA